MVFDEQREWKKIFISQKGRRNDVQGVGE